MMKFPVRVLLLAGAALAVGAGIAFAQMEPPPDPDMFGGPMGAHGRMAERFLGDFDANHDGKVTKDEFEKGLAQKYAAVSGRNGGLTADAFAGAHMKELRAATDQNFRRADWNGDGKLSLDEFSLAPRAKFMAMDKDGLGAISCAPHKGPDMKGPGMMHRGPGMFGRHRGMGGWRGMGDRCQEADLNKDGKVTRSEVDKTVAQKFAQAAKGGNALTPDLFYQFELGRFHDRIGKRFDKADDDHNGKLNQAEFAGPAEKMFARLDKNNDGVVTKDELTARHGRHGDHDKKGDWNKKPG